MSAPAGFTWIDKARLAAMGRPTTLQELEWLRGQGVEIVVSLTEDRLRRDWVNEAGLMVVHEPVPDMEPPEQEQLDRCVSVIGRAHEKQLAVAVHCGAGLGRTGVILACHFVHEGMSAQNAIARVRRLRPGSIETDEQAEAVVEFARRHGQPLDRG